MIIGRGVGARSPWYDRGVSETIIREYNTHTTDGTENLLLYTCPVNKKAIFRGICGGPEFYSGGSATYVGAALWHTSDVVSTSRGYFLRYGGFPSPNSVDKNIWDINVELLLEVGDSLYWNTVVAGRVYDIIVRFHGVVYEFDA